MIFRWNGDDKRKCFVTRNSSCQRMSPYSPPLLINRSRPLVSEVDDHLKSAFPVMIVQVVDPARNTIDAVVGNDRLGLFFGQVDTIANEIEASHGQIHGHRFRVGPVGHVALLDFPPVAVGQIVRFPRVSHLAQVVEERCGIP